MFVLPVRLRPPTSLMNVLAVSRPICAPFSPKYGELCITWRTCRALMPSSSHCCLAPPHRGRTYTSSPLDSGCSCPNFATRVGTGLGDVAIGRQSLLLDGGGGSMPVGTSGCTYVFAVSRGNPPLVDRGGGVSARWVAGEGGGFKKVQKVGRLLGYLTAAENYVYCVFLLLEGGGGGGAQHCGLMLRFAPWWHLSDVERAGTSSRIVFSFQRITGAAPDTTPLLPSATAVRCPSPRARAHLTPCPCTPTPA